MDAADRMKFFATLSLLVFAAEGGLLVVQRCLEPMECVPSSECSGDKTSEGDIVFKCDSHRQGVDTVCCISARLAQSPSNWTQGTSTRPPSSLPSPVTHSCCNSETTSPHTPPPASTVSSGSDNCSLALVTGDTLEHTPSSTSPATNQLLEQKMKLFPLHDCGVSTSLRVTNGHNASFGQFPWMALLGYRLRDGSLSFLCGGTLITNQYVLTAAHCLQPEGAVLEVVRLGEHSLDSDPDCNIIENYCADPVLDVPIEATIIHENFNTPYLKNDIALLRLQTPLNSSTDYIRPVCLPFGLNVTGLEEKKYQIAGWGKTDYYNSDGSAILQFTGILSVPLEDCDSRQEKEVRPLDNTQFCAGADMGRDACKGDSGGPLMETLQAPSQSTIQTYQIGIVSFGSVPCGAKYSPSVYTRVTAYLDWILDKIQP